MSMFKTLRPHGGNKNTKQMKNKTVNTCAPHLYKSTIVKHILLTPNLPKR